MTRRLYFAFLGVLLAVVTVTMALSYFFGRPFFGFLRGGPRMIGHISRMLPPVDHPEALQQAAEQMHDELGVDLLVLGPDGATLASAGAPIPLPDPSTLDRIRFHPDVLPGRGLLGAPAHGPPGSVVLARVPVPEGVARSAALRGLALLIGILLVAFAGVYPLSRSITRPLEKLTAVVEAYGRGDLKQRSGLGELGDEVGRLARTFDEMADRIQSARKSEKELLANVSHELRTPLARIKVAMELIETPDDETRRRLAVVGEEVDELDRLIADVITATRLDVAALPLRKTRLLAADVIEKARARLQAMAPDLRVQVSVAEGLAFEADEALISRALDNLLDNARKYGNGSGIDVDARRDGAFAILSVRDHGPGIPEKDLPHVFDPFFRGEAARAGPTGFGLGLALARRVATAHSGSAKAANADGGGAIISLSLPAAT